jgi:hypothetical protein
MPKNLTAAMRAHLDNLDLVGVFAEGGIIESTQERGQHVVDEHPGQSQRIVPWHPGLEVHIAEQAARPRIIAPHPNLPHIWLARLRRTYQIAPPCATFLAVR